MCEGAPNSPDARVLGKLLAGQCEIKPCGGKYGMGERIIARRESIGNDVVFGLLDGDFTEDWHTPVQQPRLWETKENERKIHLGWRWERKEIENYLIDPLIVQRIIPSDSLNIDNYRQELEKVRDSIGLYQAARIALCANRPRFKKLESSFGKKRGKSDYLFPERIDDQTCLDGIRQAVLNHSSLQIVKEEMVLQSFEKYLPECQKGGIRYQYYLTAFSGKDLLWAMDDWLQKIGLGGVSIFCERILTGIINTTEDIVDWIPEWKSLKDIITKF
jgi:hypothetical protein